MFGILESRKHREIIHSLGGEWIVYCRAMALFPLNTLDFSPNLIQADPGSVVLGSVVPTCGCLCISLTNYEHQAGCVFELVWVCVVKASYRIFFFKSMFEVWVCVLNVSKTFKTTFTASLCFTVLETKGCFWKSFNKELKHGQFKAFAQLSKVCS